jgi:hypothetical protein
MRNAFIVFKESRRYSFSKCHMHGELQWKWRFLWIKMAISGLISGSCDLRPILFSSVNLFIFVTLIYCVSRNVKMLRSSCFARYTSFSSIMLASNSRLTRKESKRWVYSLVQWIFIHAINHWSIGLAISNVKISSILTDVANMICELLNTLLIHILSHQLI